MQGITQLPTTAQQIADSASSVATSLARPRATTPQTTSTTSTDSSSSSSSSTSTITANDFLTLLVAEMKNQDPTQPTDPNAYISQMVDVNSLQQLIGINQGITSLDSAAGVSATTTSTPVTSAS
jgi:flagellar basal-body rod modification protein FlgD